MTDKIFFSYSRFDSAFVLKLANDLRNAGANIWLDQLDIPPGQHWDKEIEKALNEAESLLVIISPKSLASDNAMDEVSYALEKKKRVIPVMLTTADTPFRLRRLQQIDFTGDYQEGFKQLKQALKLEQTLQAASHFTNKDTIAANTQQQEINVDHDLWRKCCETNSVASYQAYLRTTSSKEHLEEAWKRLDTLQEKPVSRAINFPKTGGDSANGKRIILLVALLIFLVGAWAAYRMVSKHEAIQVPEDKIAEKKEKPVPAIVKPVENIVVPVNDNKPEEGNKPEPLKPGKENIHPETAGNQEKPADYGKRKPVVKQAITNNAPEKNKTEENSDFSPKLGGNQRSDAKPGDSGHTSPTIPLIKPRKETSKLQTDRIIELKLELISSLDMNEKKKTDQPVKFRLLNNVEYQGQVIIATGALVDGSITIGSKFTDIRMKNVQALNGNMIKIKSITPHTTRKEVETQKKYTGIIEKGADL